jgi:hypothetical protein
MLHCARMASRKKSVQKTAKNAEIGAAGEEPAVSADAQKGMGGSGAGHQGHNHHTFVLFVLLVVGFAALLFGLVRLVNDVPTAAPEPHKEDIGELPETIRGRREFRDWLAAWKEVEPYVSLSEFEKSDERAIDVSRLTESAIVPAKEDLFEPRSNRYAWSPDRNRFADFLSAYGGPDHAFTVWNRGGDGKIETLEYCGTPCRYDDAFWLTDDQLVLLSGIEALKDDGTPYCPGADEGEATCFQRLLVTLYDFANARLRVFRSEPHLFLTDAMDGARHARWTSGLTAREKIDGGVVDREDLIAIDGLIDFADVEVMEKLSVLAEDGTYVASVTDKTAFLDEFGATVDERYVRRGFRVRVTGILEEDRKLVLTVVRVLSAPNVIVYAPASGDSVGTSFVVSGVARTFEQNVRVQVLDPSDKVIVDTFTTADAPDIGLHGEYSLKIKLPSGKVKSGDVLKLKVFESSAKDGTTINDVSVTITFEP